MKLNGKDFELSKLETNTIPSLLAHFQIKPGTVAIEINGDMVGKENWGDTRLLEGDSIEIIKFVGGG